MIEFGREICGNPALASQREWLVTNGIGGYASGSISGELTRRYQGLLVSALDPPLGRTLMLAKLNETVTYDSATYNLTTDRWQADVLQPHGYRYIERFHLDGSVPVWDIACADALIEKRVWMEHSQNSVYVQYHILRATRPVRLELEPVVNYRGSKNIMTEHDWQMDITVQDDGMTLRAGQERTPLRLNMLGARVTGGQDWRMGYYLWIDDDRGIHPQENHLVAGAFTIELEQGNRATFVATSEDEHPNFEGALERRQQLDHDLVALSGMLSEPEEIQQLVLAADQFIVRRAFEGDPEGRSVIAGYHWFEDWGRDTMIALPGLTLVTGRQTEARQILRTYSAAVDMGMLPNRFPEDGSTPVYNTVDATPWFFEAIRAYHQATGDDELVREIFPVLVDIVQWHERGTRYDIHFDPDDGLLSTGPEGAPLTWMDARMGDFVPTPRVGKPVEVNALWYNALRSMSHFARIAGAEQTHFNDLADNLQAGFQRFWSDELGYCLDVLDGPRGNDSSLRPNQLFAVSLEHSPLESKQQLAILDTCARRLLTSHGLRSLDEDDPDYINRYEGDLRSRDAAYHQGTVWSWLIGSFASSHFRVHGDAEAARAFLKPLFLHLSDHGIGTISEVFDAEPPFFGRGCIAQAWGVAEILRVWRQTT